MSPRHLPRLLLLLSLVALLPLAARAQRTAVVDVNLVVGGPQARSGAGVTISLWGDSSTTVRHLRGRLWRDTTLVDTLLALTAQRLSARLGRPVRILPYTRTPAAARPTTADPKLGTTEMLRRKNRIGDLPAFTLAQAFAAPPPQGQGPLDHAIVIDCSIARDGQGEGAGRLTDRGARERAVVSLSLTLTDRSGRRLLTASAQGLSNDRWKYYSRVMGLRQNDTSLSGREILDLYVLALERALADRAIDRFLRRP